MNNSPISPAAILNLDNKLFGFVDAAGLMGVDKTSFKDRGKYYGDANNITAAGIYTGYIGTGYSDKNWPTDFGCLIHFQSVAVVQIVIESSLTNPKTFIRAYWNSWSNWVQIG